MDKLVYYKQINDETKVAYQNVDKFKKFGKIRKIIEEEVKEEEKKEEWVIYRFAYHISQNAFKNGNWLLIALIYFQ